MTKKMLPALIGALFAATTGVAAADVSLVGHIDTSLNVTDNDAGDDMNFACTTCAVGFKGNEDLGNGLKAIFFIDFQYDTTDTVYNRDDIGSDGSEKAESQNTIKDRDQWLGLSGVFGQLRVGTISTLYKSHGAMIDPLYRTALQGRDHGLQSQLHNNSGEELEGRATNTLRWDSPDYNGLQLGAHYTLDRTEADGESDDPYGIGASYRNDSMLAFADFVDNNQSGSGERNAWKVGGKYDVSLFSFMGQYEDITNAGSDDEEVWHVAAGVNGLLGMNIYVGYGEAKDDTSDDESSTWSLAISHDFSKNTSVYVGHSQLKCDTGGSSPTLSACSGVTADGGEDDQTSFGIKHRF